MTWSAVISEEERELDDFALLVSGQEITKTRISQSCP